MSWTYDAGDAGIRLFTTAMDACGEHMPVTAGSRLLDVGCNEEDWVVRANEAWPEAYIYGLDWRATDWKSDDGRACKVKGNGLDPGTFAAESFDGIVGLSAFEHFGLGHYARDPVDPDGDIHVIANCWRWLKPGGWLYFDVPYDPRKYWVAGTSHRMYDDVAVQQRLWIEPLAEAKVRARWHWTGYVEMHRCGELIEKPATQPDDRLHFYVAICAQKLG